MEYFVKRGEQRFGPYSLSDLQQYVQSGNLAAGDLAQSEGMTDWVPLSQVLGNIPAMAMAGGGVAVATAAEPQLVELPPNLHWSIVLILGLLTRQLFNRRGSDRAIEMGMQLGLAPGAIFQPGK